MVRAEQLGPARTRSRIGYQPAADTSGNSILPLLGGLVVDAGGPLCHAAIVAREFSLPAVIGAARATTEIPDGALVEIDPVVGCVRIVD